MSTLELSYTLPSGQSLEIAGGDLTREKVDAVVNAANAYLQHGGGLAAAITRAGGDTVQKESSAWVLKYGPVPHEKPAYTGPGALPCRYIIHAVGPIYGEGDEDRKLASAVTGSLELAESLQLASIAFPAISTGIFGFPRDRAALIMFDSIEKYFVEHPASGIHLVKITLFDQSTLDIFMNVFRSRLTGHV